MPDAQGLSVPDTPDDPWLHTLYQEAWRQYEHEGNKIYTRSSLFVGLQAGLFAVLTGLALPLLTLNAPPQTNNVTELGLRAFGAVLTILGAFSAYLAHIWKGVVLASRRYFNLRWLTAYAIEAAVPRLKHYGLAHLEHAYREHSRVSPGGSPTSADFVPFAGYSELSAVRIPSLGRRRGFNALQDTAAAWFVLSVLAAIGGVVLVIYSFT